MSYGSYISLGLVSLPGDVIGKDIKGNLRILATTIEEGLVTAREAAVRTAEAAAAAAAEAVAAEAAAAEAAAAIAEAAAATTCVGKGFDPSDGLADKEIHNGHQKPLSRILVNVDLATTRQAAVHSTIQKNFIA
jgi:hypothetical protein